MQTNLSVRLTPETVRSVAAASVGAGYTAIGTPIANPAKILLFQNGTDANVMISFDGVNDHLPVFAGAFVLLDASTNRTDPAGSCTVPANTTFYVKRIGTPTTGSVYLSTFYGS